MTVDLTGKPICITGASSGIGAATAIACARAGMPVALMARRAEKLETVAARIREIGGTALVQPGDVNSPEDCLALLDRAESEFGPVYAAFANAGYGIETEAWSQPEQSIRDMFETNFYGSLNLVRPALKRFVDRGAGHALLCASCLSKLAVPHYAAYSASKAAQDHFARAIRHELAPRGVAVSSVHPIGTDTEFFDTAAQNSDNPRLLPKIRTGLQPPSKVADAIVRQLRRGRGGEVWTSLPARTLFGLANTFPALADWGIRRRFRNRLAQHTPNN